jgi:hypothetical protein
VVDVASKLDAGADLLAAPFPSGGSVEDARAALVGRLGENITVRRWGKLSVETGLVHSYVHMGGKVGALLAVEAPASASRDALREFADNTAMHIAAMSPRYLSDAEVDADFKVKTLLVHGHARDVERARRQGELLVLSERQLSPSGPGGWLVGATLAAALIAAALGWPLAVCALAGALTLVLLRCVDPGEALEAIDWSVILLTGGLLALGRAFVDHGLGTTTASAILSLEFLGDSHHALLGAVILCTSLLTQLTTNVSAVVVMAPVALSLAQQAGADPRPFLVAVALSASFAFLSAVGHAANTMVAGPGDYRFVHFLRVGAPLLVLEAGLLLALVPVLWPF